MALSILITQCLQHDFIAPLDLHEPLPNRLHVGPHESTRLLGADPETGPIAQLMSWARAQPEDQLAILHVTDWHDPEDPAQQDHLRQFGPHCLQETPGAALVLGLDAAITARANESVVRSIALNDFEHTTLGDTLRALAATTDAPIRVGVVGVWTEAKVSFLLYDLKTRMGVDALATCSALTASASRAQHFNALEQLRRLLGVEAFDSVGEFMDWLVPDAVESPLDARARDFGSALQVEGVPDDALDATDRDLIGLLYRDSRAVTLRALGGGFSGARVFQVRSRDAFGHEQAPSVAKLGPRALISKERASFERVESVLGNHAPSVRGFVDLGERAGLKYSYASMGFGAVQTFKARFEGGADLENIRDVLDEVFVEILGKFYVAATYEHLDIFEHYSFRDGLAERVQQNIKDIIGDAAEQPQYTIQKRAFTNLTDFYKTFLKSAEADRLRHAFHLVSYVHGDLNGANILIDSRENVWVIDYFHTARGHLLRDLAKLENDLLFIFTPLPDDEALEQALRITDALRLVGDLRAPLGPPPEGVERPELLRSWHTLAMLREHIARMCREYRNVNQYRVAQLRYAAHTMTFDESSHRHKLWALAAASGHAEDIARHARRDTRLRVDWVDRPHDDWTGALGLTICPGRADRGRSLSDDLATLREDGAAHLVCLLPEHELRYAEVPDLRERAEAAGLTFHHVPIPDQKIPTLAAADALVRTILTALHAGDRVVVHCLGGLGRSGTIVACALTRAGLSATQAIQSVRAARSPRAVETTLQETFVADFASHT